MAALISPLIQHMYRNHMAMPFGDILGTHQESVFFAFTASGNNQAVVGKPIYFASNPSFDGENAIITGIEVIDFGTIPTIPTQPSVTNLDQDQLSRATLTLSNAKREQLAEIPLRTLVRFQTGGVSSAIDIAKITPMFWIKDQLWQNCYITFNAIPAGVGVGTGIWLNVTYIDRKELVK